MSTPTLEDLTVRVERIERRHRRVRAAVSAVGAAVVAFVLTGAAQPRPAAEVRAQRIVVTD